MNGTADLQSNNGWGRSKPQEVEPIGKAEEPISVFVVSELRLYREGLTELLTRDHGIRVLGSAENLGDRHWFLDMHPDLLLVDVAAGDGANTVRALAEREPAAKIVALGVSETEADVIACVEAGAIGYVSRSASLVKTVEALKSAAREEATCSPRVAAKLMRRVRALAKEQASARSNACLTSRETDVLAFLEQGLSNKEIAGHLSLEVATVKNHVHSILQKLGLPRRAHVTLWARQHQNGAKAET